MDSAAALSWPPYAPAACSSCPNTGLQLFQSSWPSVCVFVCLSYTTATNAYRCCYQGAHRIQ